MRGFHHAFRVVAGVVLDILDKVRLSIFPDENHNSRLVPLQGVGDDSLGLLRVRRPANPLKLRGIALIGNGHGHRRKAATGADLIVDILHGVGSDGVTSVPEAMICFSAARNSR